MEGAVHQHGVQPQLAAADAGHVAAGSRADDEDFGLDLLHCPSRSYAPSPGGRGIVGGEQPGVLRGHSRSGDQRRFYQHDVPRRRPGSSW